MADGYFTGDSMLRRVVSERVMVLAGGRTLLMQAAHPVAWAGFFAHTGALDEPYERLNRTAAVLNAIGFGTRAEADRLTRRVRAMHRRVTGELREPAGRFPAGTPYAADDPALLLWILATLVDSAMTVYPRYVRALSWAERDALWRDYKIVGNLFGLADADMPDGIDEFGAYMHHMLHGGDLLVVPEARDLGVHAGGHPPPVRLLVGSGAAPRPARRGGVHEARAAAAAAGEAAGDPAGRSLTG
jgi:uncharacterized protein (DUF2236 family)